MAAFSFQHNPYILDPVYLPNSSIETSHFPHQAGEMSNASSCFTNYYHSSETIQESSTNSLDVVVIPTPQVSMEKKRRQSDGSCLSTADQSKGAKECKGRRQKKSSGCLKTTLEEKKSKSKDMKDEKASEEPPSGYIHVRARRGQATDSHSLAERVRRERISERMKKLQELVPGCDKVIGKALVLDEIINYVQSLQNQVEFLSMKLASVNPILYDFGVGYDDFMSPSEERGSMSQPMASISQTSHIPSTAFEGATNNIQVEDTCATFSLHGHGPATFPQDSGGFILPVGDHRRGFVSQAEINNVCSFQ